MRIEDIHSLVDLQDYLKYEIVQQRISRKPVEINLPSEWFCKLYKFIQFNLKYNPNEKGAKEDITEEDNKFVLKINGIFTIVKRR